MGATTKGSGYFQTGDHLPFVFKQAILQSLHTYETAVSTIVRYGDRDVMDAFIEHTRAAIEKGLNAMADGTEYKKVE